MPRLTFQDATGQWRAAELGKGSAEVTIGSHNTNDICVQHADVGRRHARVFFDPARNCYMLYNLSFSTGTRINNTRVTSQVLRHGDQIQCGAFTLCFEEGEPGAKPSRSQPEKRPSAPPIAPSSRAIKGALHISEEVQHALWSHKPVVALESTIICHGFPQPENLVLARALEGVVRGEGAIPATIAIVDGTVCVGVSSEQLTRMATSDAFVKCSARDLGPLCASGGCGATTVAATSHIAALAGIRVFATGGIGGVHRGAEQSMDISADLAQIARTPVAVVSSGAKVILDLARTLEVLETYGIPVIGYQCREFPAFYTTSSGLALPHSFDDPQG